MTGVNDEADPPEGAEPVHYEDGTPVGHIVQWSDGTDRWRAWDHEGDCVATGLPRSMTVALLQLRHEMCP